MKEKKLLGGRDKVRVAVAQAAPVFMDKEKTIEKVCRLMKEAGQQGAELIVFPETLIPAYPAFYTSGWESQPSEWSPYIIALQDNSVVVGSQDTETLGQAAREAGLYAAIGCNELDDRPGSRTLYNTLLFLGRDGRVLGRHRKLMPTFSERTYWGWGDASDLFVLDTDIGRIGGLICAENLMVLLKAAMMSKGEEFHIAVWPGAWSGRGRQSLLDPETDPQGNTCPLYPIVRSYALEAQCFVLSASGFLRPEDFPAQWQHLLGSHHMNFSSAVGGSAVVNPFGRLAVGPTFGEETILYADCHANQIKTAKAIFDVLGHYTRWDVARLQVREEPWTPEVAFPVQVSRETLQRISQENDIALDKLEAIIEELNQAAAPI